MTGLLDFLNTPAGQGLLSGVANYAASAGRGGPVNSIGRGLLGGLAGYGQAQDRISEQAQLAKRNELFDLQLAQGRQALDDKAGTRAWLESQNPQMLASQAALAGGGGPTVANASKIQPVEPLKQVIWEGARAGAIPVSEFINSMKPKERKVKSSEVGRDPSTGQMVNFVLYEDGTTSTLPFGVKPNITMQGLGNRVVAIDQNAVGNGQSFDIGQSPDNAASVGATLRGQNLTNALGWANHNQSGALGWANNEVSRGNLQLQTEKHRTEAAAGPKLTEDQAKASGWLVQASNAHQNMLAAIKNSAGSAKPGLSDGVAAIPGFGGIGNWMRPTERQQFLQGASSLSESLLRAATGAGVNEHEAKQKVAEVTPQFGDDDATIKQKMDAIPLFIDSLKMRAGPGAAGASAVLEKGQAARAQATNPVGGVTRDAIAEELARRAKK